MCYFKARNEKDARGWIFLKDISHISDDKSTFTLVSVARTMVLEALTRAEHKLWLQAIVDICPNANTSQISCEFINDLCYSFDITYSLHYS